MEDRIMSLDNTNTTPRYQGWQTLLAGTSLIAGGIALGAAVGAGAAPGGFVIGPPAAAAF